MLAQRLIPKDEENLPFHWFNKHPDRFGVFEVSKPPQIISGVSSAFRNVFVGVTLGAFSLVALPAIHVKKYGARGFILGVFGGVVGGITLVTCGVASGVFQMTRGVINTPEAVVKSAQGKTWNVRQQKYLKYSLSQEIEESLSSPKNTHLYELLNVSPESTPQEIKTAYYQLAKSYHPDKNPDHQETFQQITAAYRILINPKLRQQYHATGEIASSNLLQMVFANESISSLIGDLTPTDSPWDAQLNQHLKEIQVAKNLLQLIEHPPTDLTEYIQTPAGKAFLPASKKR